MFRLISKIFKIVSAVLSVILVLAFGLILLNNAIGFIQNQTLLTVLEVIKEYGTLVLLFLVGGSFMLKHWWSRIVYILIILLFVVGISIYGWDTFLATI